MSKSRKVPSIAFVRPEDNFMNSGEYGDDPAKLAEYMRKIYASSVPDQPVAQPREAAQSLAGLNKSIDLLYGRLLQVNEDVINARQFDVSPIFGLITDVKREATQIKNPSDVDASAIGNRAGELVDLANAISAAGPPVVQSNSKIMKEIQGAIAALNQVSFTHTMASEMAPPTPPPPKPPASARTPPPLPSPVIPAWMSVPNEPEIQRAQREYQEVLAAATRAEAGRVLSPAEVEDIVTRGFEVMSRGENAEAYTKRVAREKKMNEQSLLRQIAPEVKQRDERLDALRKSIRSPGALKKEVLRPYEVAILRKEFLERASAPPPLNVDEFGRDLQDPYQKIANSIQNAADLARYAQTATRDAVIQVAMRLSANSGEPIEEYLRDAGALEPLDLGEELALSIEDLDKFETLPPVARGQLIAQLIGEAERSVSGLSGDEAKTEMALIREIKKGTLDAVAKGLGVSTKLKKLVLFKVIARIPSAVAQLPEADRAIAADLG